MQGDNFDGQIVKSFKLFTTQPKVMSAPRSFDAAGSIAVALTFTNQKTAIVRIGIP